METDGLPTPRRHWAMAAVAITISMAAIDSAIANVALPTIARSLHASPADSIWVVNAYQVAILACLLPLASLGEILGYRRVYQAGALLFTLASLGCAFSQTMGMLITARMIQGIGAAAIMSMNSAVLRHVFPHKLLGRGLGTNAMVISLSSAGGPTLCSAILLVAPWPWLFAINGPLGVIALVIGWFALPESLPAGRRFDVLSAVLNALTFGPLLMGIEGLAHGGTGVLSGLEVAIGVLAGAALVVRSLSRTHPLVPFDLLRIPIFMLSVATSTASFIAQTFCFVALPFLLEYSLGRTPVETGLMMTPWPLAVGIVAPISGRLSDRLPGAVLGCVGLGLLAAGLFALALVGHHANAFEIGWRMAVCGAGFGLFQAPNNRAMLFSAPRDRAGSAGGMLGTARLTGQSLGAILVALVFRLYGGPPGMAVLAVAGAFALVAAAVSARKLKGVEPAPGLA